MNKRAAKNVIKKIVKRDHVLPEMLMLWSLSVNINISYIHANQQFTLDGEQLVPNNIYDYLVYGDDRIVGLITAHHDENGNIVTGLVTGAFSISSDLFYIYMDPNSSSYRTIEVVAAAKSDGTKLGIDVGGTTMYWRNSLYDIH